MQKGVELLKANFTIVISANTITFQFTNTIILIQKVQFGHNNPADKLAAILFEFGA